MSVPQLARLYDDHAPALFRFLMALAGHEADARDLLQELFLRAARRPEKEVWDDPAAWLFRAARNLHTDFLRRRGTRERTLQVLTQEPLEKTGVVEDHDEEWPQRAASALRALPDEQREVVHLKIYERLTFHRIGEMLGIPANTAASRYRYAMEKLRTLLPNPCISHEA